MLIDIKYKVFMWIRFSVVLCLGQTKYIQLYVKIKVISCQNCTGNKLSLWYQLGNLRSSDRHKFKHGHDHSPNNSWIAV